MITLTKIDGSPIVINADEIETIEANFNPTLVLRSGRKVVVVESSEEIVEKVIAYKKECFSSVLVKPFNQDS